GNSRDFWDGACGVRLDDDYSDVTTRPRFEVFPARDGWLVYRPTGLWCGYPHHYRVREEAAYADFPAVVKHLNRPERPQWYREQDRPAWREADPAAADPRLFLRHARAAHLTQLEQKGPGRVTMQLAGEKAVDEQWWRARNWRPMVIALELIYFL